MMLVAPVVHRLLPRHGGWLLALLPAAIVGWLVYQAPHIANGATLREGFAWLPALDVEITFLLDGLSLLFALLVSGIGTLIVIYAQGYFDDDPRLRRLYVLLFFFMGSMLGVVLADNLFALFVFWELTGIASFLLIGFDNHKEVARNAAWQALIVTTAGGLALMAGVVLLGLAADSFSLAEIVGTSLADHPYYGAILALILAAAFTKSAQFPFHFWLPNAMAAPTPISAYLHSATMVKAGVYLVARLYPTLGGTDLWFFTVGAGGAVTVVVSSVLALRATALKRQLAYTTVGGLGLMIMCLGLNSPAAAKAALLFIVVHACYKAALFMSAGAITHAAQETDTEKLGGLFRALPVTALGAALAALSMAGLPPLLGFIGKETIYKATLDLPLGVYAITGAAIFGSAVNLYAATATGIRPFLPNKAVHAPEKRHENVALALGTLTLGILGLGLGLFPYPVGHYVLQPALSAVIQKNYEVHLALWHGVNLPLMLSGATLLLGLGLYFLRTYLRKAMNLLNFYPGGFSRAYQTGVESMLKFAAATTGAIQNGALRSYVLMTVIFIVALPGSALMFSRLRLLPDHLPSLSITEVFLLLIINLAALNVVRVRSRLHAVASLGIVGYGVSLIFVLYGAPDLAMTQFVTETLTLLLFVLVLHKLPAFRRYSNRSTMLRDVAVAGLAGAFMFSIVLASLRVKIAPSISDYFVENSYPLAHGRNIVNVILVDFRALDTLGEITVLVVAALGAFGLLRRTRRPGAREKT
jgi:multicomponent Na+:H+ antiporter subunit A